MKRIAPAVAVALIAPMCLIAATLFNSAAQSKWSVSDGKTTIATATVTTDGKRVRVDWAPTGGSASSFVAADGKVWVKGDGGDATFGTYKEKPGLAIVPALLLPVQTAAANKLTASGATATSYSFGGSSATYTYDAKGAQKIEIAAGGAKYTLTRTALTAGAGSASSFYEVKQKPSRLAGMKSLAGGLLGESDTSVSASAGVKGMDEAEALKEGIDLAAVERLIARDKSQGSAREAALRKFQKEGKVGGAQ